MEFFSTINSVYVLIGSLILGASAGMLGAFAVLRKQGLLGDALAHASLPGIAIAFLIMETKFLPGLLLGALVSGLVGAFLIYFLVANTKVKMDSAMALVLSVFFGTGVLILTYIQKLPISSQSGLESFMFGQAASLLESDIIWMAAAFLVILTLVVLFWKELKIFIFDPEYAKVLGFKRYLLELIFTTIFVTSILMSLQAVGVVLTAALFITPAVAALFWSSRLIWVVIISTVFGMASGFSGAFISSVFEKMPTGPVIVLVATLIFLISFLFAPKKGVLSKAMQHKRSSIKTQMENVLGRFYRDYERGVMNLKKQDYVAYGYRMNILSLLKRRGLVVFNGDGISLTDVGMKEAQKIVEKHRLWETYLVNQFHLAPDHVHRDAEMMEHILTDEMVAKIRAILKNPTKDPHGKPIKSL